MSDLLVDGLWHGPITDQHIHLDRGNRFLAAVDEFTRCGGTGLMLVHKPGFSSDLPTDRAGYEQVYAETLAMAEDVRRAYGITVGVVLGPHPVAWHHQMESLGLARSTELHLEAVDLALKHIEEGTAHCLGEVGRPHYPVSEAAWSAANEMLLEIMQSAAGAGTSIQLHVEDNGDATYAELAELATKANLPLSRTIRHYAPANVSGDFTHGLACTVSVGSGSVEALCASHVSAGAYWGMETDYLDDPRRPGAVLGPKTIPKRTNELCRALLKPENEGGYGMEVSEVEELMLNIHSRWPSELYGVEF